MARGPAGRGQAGVLARWEAARERERVVGNGAEGGRELGVAHRRARLRWLAAGQEERRRRLELPQLVGAEGDGVRHLGVHREAALRQRRDRQHVVAPGRGAVPLPRHAQPLQLGRHRDRQAARQRRLGRADVHALGRGGRRLLSRVDDGVRAVGERD